MTDSTRKLTKVAIATNLSAIRTANGYNTDAGDNVSTESVQIPAGSSATINVRLEVIQKATNPAVVRTHRLTIWRVAILVPTSLDNVEDVLDLAIDDVERAMKDKQATYPPGVSCPEFLDTTPTAPEDGKKWIGAVIRYQTHVPIR
jgi:hypothetical protein